MFNGLFNGHAVDAQIEELILRHDCLKTKVMFGYVFVFYFQKPVSENINKKTIFLYFLNQKHVWLVEIKKKKVF